MNLTALTQAVDTLVKLHVLYNRMQVTAMELFAHPEAADADIVQVARKLGELRTRIRYCKRVLIPLVPSYGALRMRLDRVNA